MGAGYVLKNDATLGMRMDDGGPVDDNSRVRKDAAKFPDYDIAGLRFFNFPAVFQYAFEVSLCIPIYAKLRTVRRDVEFFDVASCLSHSDDKGHTVDADAFELSSVMIRGARVRLCFGDYGCALFLFCQVTVSAEGMYGNPLKLLRLP